MILTSKLGKLKGKSIVMGENDDESKKFYPKKGRQDSRISK